ncbi:MAG: putative toxin-antitoxin system toxin component, PIN family [Moraxellaceae bacterium]|nr:putative toxin-antitoxin system toxin component, PIN family [Moraxellaceae bacterium]
MKKAVIDTNIIVSAIQTGDSISRDILRLVFLGHLIPLMSNALFLEYEAVTQRAEVMRRCHFSAPEAEQFLDAVFASSQWVEIYLAWRPNLLDEGDNFLIELAVAGNADYLITHNMRDLRNGELLFPQLLICNPQQFMVHWRSQI